MQNSSKADRHSTAQVAAMAGIHKDTLLRWLRAGLVPEPDRDRHGWRLFDQSQAEVVVKFALTSEPSNPSSKYLPTALGSEIERLKGIDWDFSDAKTDYLTHGLHPYPAKYIPQIPNALIQELSVTGETVGDIFCGSGTTLVEALTLKRHAVGVDANPLACLMTRAKTTTLSSPEIDELCALLSTVDALAQSVCVSADDGLWGASAFRSSGARPALDEIGFWFDESVTEELAEAKRLCRDVSHPSAKEVALCCLSSIIVAVSKQDSDTRYVRREKSLSPGDVLRRFGRSLKDAIRRVSEFSDVVEPRFRADVVCSSVLDSPVVPPLDLVVCSPPYPNAYSYHLYHRTRMLWLDMDQPTFKREEIGSHRKYSSKGKNAATVDTFRAEMERIFAWLRFALKPRRYACFVVGDSTLAGKRIDNASLLADAAAVHGFSRVADLQRTMQATKKAFNPSIGRIKTETILVLQNSSGREA